MAGIIPQVQQSQSKHDNYKINQNQSKKSGKNRIDWYILCFNYWKQKIKSRKTISYNLQKFSPSETMRQLDNEVTALKSWKNMSKHNYIPNKKVSLTREVEVCFIKKIRA